MEAVMAHILYKLTFENGKAYIGQTVRKLETRMTQHAASARRGSDLPVHCAWRKYGYPTVAVMGEYDSPEELHSAEIEAIISNGTLSPDGYNIAFGGETSPAKNPDVARKISEATMGRPSYITAERRKAMMDERWQSEDYRAAQSEALTAKWADPEYRARMSAMHKARWEAKKADGWVPTPNEKLKGRIFSDDARAKMSASAKARWQRKMKSDLEAA
jgi:nitroreductase